MIIETKFHGRQTVADNEVIHFDSGIPGFPDEKKFGILTLEHTPFLVLQSVQTTDIAFIIMDPFLTFPDYEFDLPDEVLKGLQVKENKEIAVFVILTIQEPFEQTTANLQAPIILNQGNHKAKQYILNRSPYTTKHLIIQPSVEKGEK
nr:flagellar assembly protein FliW [uncultured Bacillus sp.]